MSRWKVYGTRNLPQQAEFQDHSRAEGTRVQTPDARAQFRDPETCGESPALRLQIGIERGAAELGHSEGAQSGSQRQAAGDACRRSSARVWRVRGRDSAQAV